MFTFTVLRFKSRAQGFTSLGSFSFPVLRLSLQSVPHENQINARSEQRKHMTPPTSPVWPAAVLAAELRALNRAYMKDHHNPLLNGRDSWPNEFAGAFAEELALAKELGITPLSPEQPEFLQLLASGQRFNWVVLLDGSVRISPSIVMSENGLERISHAVLCYNGGAVLAAGEGRAGGRLTNTTGHYRSEAFVLPPVREAFAQLGIQFAS
jgi:hypothetical protein